MTNGKKVIVLGSSRSDGNTRKAVSKVVGERAIELIDLRSYDITQFDYDHRNNKDDFLPLIERLLAFDILVLATPVYWYTMSAIMKVFIDRFSDLLVIRKDLGRQLRGKKIFVIASYSTSIPKGFEDTFQQTCEYLGIEYLGTSFLYDGDQDAQFKEHSKHEIAKAQTALGLII